MSDLTQILNAIDAGDPQAADQLMPLVYDELRQMAARKLAHEKPGQTLDATALVHEAYLRLVDAGETLRFSDRVHFYPGLFTSVFEIGSRGQNGLASRGQLAKHDF